jgi:orotidine-5'-phosphate decarboxylase
MQGYADAYLAPGAPLAADAVTLSPYLGFGSLAPALDTAETAGRGVFVLARTSNAEGAAVQAAVADGRSVAQGIVDEAAARNRGVAPVGGVGLVVGATADHGLDLAALNGPVLAPGLGAQGAGAADIAARFRGVRGPVLPSASRSVLAVGPDPLRLRSAAEALRDELAAAR